MLKPICVLCACFFRCKKAGYYFIEGMPNTQEDALQRGRDAVGWKPYKIWVGDLWECPNCHAQIVSGVAHQPLSEHYKEDFEEVRQRTKADRLQVNDC
jgi:hypothetical protein